MSHGFPVLLERLSRSRGVRGSLIVNHDDGLVILAHVQIGLRSDHIAAFAATVYRRMRLAAGAARFGAISFIQLDAERGHVCVAGRGDIVVVVLADPGANIGLIRAELLKAAESLA